MENNSLNKENESQNNNLDSQKTHLTGDLVDKIEKNEVGVQHDEDGNIIKIAENAVPPKAWNNQKKAYNDAYENNKNQQLEDDIN